MTILPNGLDVARPQAVAGGGADALGEWMPAALAARQIGAAPCPYRTALQAAVADAHPLEGQREPRGRGLSRQDPRGLAFGSEYPFLSPLASWTGRLMGPRRTAWPFRGKGSMWITCLQRQAEGISRLSSNEHWRVIDNDVSPADLGTFSHEGQGVGTLEDGRYALEDAALKESMVKFLRASGKGWKWSGEHPWDAAMIALDVDETDVQTKTHQVKMMRDIANVTAGSDRARDPADSEPPSQRFYRAAPIRSWRPNQEARGRMIFGAPPWIGLTPAPA